MITDTKKIRQFDGAASSIKVDPPSKKCAPFEEREVVPVFGEEPGSKAGPLVPSFYNSEDLHFLTKILSHVLMQIAQNGSGDP